MAGMPLAGISTLFYVALLLGMGATKAWRWAVESLRRMGKRRWEKLEGSSLYRPLG